MGDAEDFAQNIAYMDQQLSAIKDAIKEVGQVRKQAVEQSFTDQEAFTMVMTYWQFRAIQLTKFVPPESMM